MNERTNNNQLIKMENARLIFKNFNGNATEFNAEGNRVFSLVIPDEELANQLREDGWNIKEREPKDPEDPVLYHLPVKVKFGKIPPIIMMITSRGKIRLDEETVGQLDWARMKNVDIIVRPYHYPPMPGRPAGISAYLKSLYVTIDEDEFEMKYADIPDVD